MRHGILLAAATAVAVLAGCATERPTGTSQYYSGNYAEARTIYEGNLKAEKNSRALYLLRLGTLELDSGNVMQAREYFTEAAGIMTDFKASGGFKALAGHESSKEYKGDPYEKMMCLWYLGLTDYMLGKYNMALPSFKSAALADGGTTEERYQADAASVFIMMARAYQAMGDSANAQAEYKEAAGVYTFRQTVDIVTRGLMRGRDDVLRKAENEKAVEAAYSFIADGIAAGATQAQAPADALAAAKEFAFAELERASKSRSEKDRLLGQDPNVIGGYIKDICAAAEKCLSPPAGQPQGSPLEATVQELSDPSKNLLVVVGIGQGPFKYREGEYGELAKIGHRDYPDRYAEVFVDGEPAGRAETVEDMYYQASTRGGRAMDSLLRGKAVFKDVTKYAGIGALGVAALSDSRRTQEAALIAGAALLISSLATQPEADIRSWETLPDRIQMAAARVAPGRHKVEVRFYSAEGIAITRYTRVCPDVEVKEGQDTLIYVRSGAQAIVCPPAGGAAQ